LTWHHTWSIHLRRLPKSSHRCDTRHTQIRWHFILRNLTFPVGLPAIREVYGALSWLYHDTRGLRRPLMALSRYERLTAPSHGSITIWEAYGALSWLYHDMRGLRRPLMALSRHTLYEICDGMTQFRARHAVTLYFFFLEIISNCHTSKLFF
jgi:hypothetical protein